MSVQQFCSIEERGLIEELRQLNNFDELKISGKKTNSWNARTRELVAKKGTATSIATMYNLRGERTTCADAILEFNIPARLHRKIC